jgi:hypothetical protein
MNIELTIEDYLSMVAWWQTLPGRVKPLIAQFPPGSRWRLRRQSEIGAIGDVPVRDDDWFGVQGFTQDGKVQLRLCSGASGETLPVECVARPVDLVPAGN